MHIVDRAITLRVILAGIEARGKAVVVKGSEEHRKLLELLNDLDEQVQSYYDRCIRSMRTSSSARTRTRYEREWRRRAQEEVRNRTKAYIEAFLHEKTTT